MKESIAAHFDGEVFVPDEPVQLAKGHAVRVLVAEQSESHGMKEEAWPTDPEGIARLLALMNSFEPLEMTPEDDARWREAIEAQGEYDQSQAAARINRIQRSFE